MIHDVSATSTDVTRSASVELAAHTPRHDIQGLRAIAVVAVVAFHAGLPVPGGYVGVDVFFVISGFVITAMLMREHARSGRLSLGSFYRRRVTRLLPALALMVTVTLVLTAILGSPFNGQQEITALTGAGAVLAVANVVLALRTGGYFETPPTANPLLNTWSLSVEEQFYLVFPFVLVVLWWVSRRWARQHLGDPHPDRRCVPPCGLLVRAELGDVDRPMDVPIQRSRVHRLLLRANEGMGVRCRGAARPARWSSCPQGTVGRPRARGGTCGHRGELSRSRTRRPPSPERLRCFPSQQPSQPSPEVGTRREWRPERSRRGRWLPWVTSRTPGTCGTGP